MLAQKIPSRHPMAPLEARVSRTDPIWPQRGLFGQFVIAAISISSTQPRGANDLTCGSSPPRRNHKALSSGAQGTDVHREAEPTGIGGLNDHSARSEERWIGVSAVVALTIFWVSWGYHATAAAELASARRSAPKAFALAGYQLPVDKYTHEVAGIHVVGAGVKTRVIVVVADDCQPSWSAIPGLRDFLTIAALAHDDEVVFVTYDGGTKVIEQLAQPLDARARRHRVLSAAQQRAQFVAASGIAATPAVLVMSRAGRILGVATGNDTSGLEELRATLAADTRPAQR